MVTTLSSKGQIVIPQEIRKVDGIAPGQQFEFEREGTGCYRLRLVSHPNDGFVDWLVSCPVPDFLETTKNEELTSDLRPPML